jgi:hypothetical protein
MPLTSNDIVNAALQQIGNNQQAVSGQAPTFDSSVPGKAAQLLYPRCVQTAARQFGWDFSRNTAGLTLSGNSAPLGWLYEYLYPTNGIQVRQILPPSIDDPNDPLPQNWSVGNTLVSNVSKKVIWSNTQNAVATFTNQPLEDTWDPLFVEAVIRLLASEFAMAIAGKPDTASSMLQSAGQFEKIGESRDS